MKKYIVIALSVGGLGNKIFNSGDTVVEGNFKAGRADELVAQGFLQMINDNGAEVIKTPTLLVAEEVKETEDTGDTVKTLDEISKAEIIAELTARGVEFDATANKKTLYALWIKK